MSNEKEEVTTQCSAGLNISGVSHYFEYVGITDSPDFESQALHLLLVRLALLLTAEDDNCIHSTICPTLPLIPTSVIFFACSSLQISPSHLFPPVVVDDLLDKGQTTLVLHQLAILVRAHLVDEKVKVMMIRK